MKRNSILAYIAAILFAVAAVISFINGSVSRGVISSIAVLSFLLAALHWGRSGRTGKKSG